MNRRYFLQGMGGILAGGVVPNLTQAQSSHRLGIAKDLFHANARLTPLRGYQGQDVSCDQAWIEGTIPTDLRGDFFRNGPGLFERGGQRYHHWFDGDGMVHAWRFSERSVSHQARFVRTKKFIAEQQAGEFLVPAFGTAIRPKIPLRSSDTMNTANTNVIKLDGRLYALWEGGSAHAMDSQNLETRELVTWAPELAGMPFSAHPKVEPDGTMWNFGTMMGKLILYKISKQGKLLQHHVMNAPSSAMVHDFVISQNHLIFMFSPISLNIDAVRSGQSMVDSMEWKGQESTKVLLIEKDDFSRTTMLELPAMMLFHFGNAWEEDQTIRLDFVKSTDLGNFKEWMPKMMQGQDIQHGESTPAFLHIDLRTKRVRITQRTEVVEFPRVDPRYVGRRNRFLFYPVATESAEYRTLNGVMRLDLQTGKTEQFDFADRMRLEEHVVVPKAGAAREGEAWLVGVGFDVQRQTSFASVFDAENLSAGPVALAHLPYWTPHCFHGNFYPTSSI
ncbi:carotenoid oxygenase family protein [Undibacterium fentianense]|uniref:Carotenoid oxygenase family protein n=1 Tax=Undibacterium fentianense TaxID=2828728 RepID=A0A941E0A9_9BURK|nr:carotenoid oxygenase family protein [Undibacterium fentianense]MBR7800844.1 carotenoid oxygenase family protein [Undibacterium fentianense]